MFFVQGLTSSVFSQKAWLHVYDPKALYHIFIKDQEKFYKGKLALAYVGSSYLLMRSIG